jgi:hypothetical protein
MKYLKLFENFRVNEDKFHDNLNGYTLFGNKEKEEKSGFCKGDKVEFDFKKTDGTVTQTVEGVVDSVYGEPENQEDSRTKFDYPIKNWAVVVRASNSLWQFGSDTSKFQWSLDDLRKI